GADRRDARPVRPHRRNPARRRSDAAGHGGEDRMKTALLVLAAALALAGCYVSKTLLLEPRQAVQPLAVGTFSDPKDPGVLLDISLEPDGWYRFYAIGDNTVGRVLFTPLKGQDRIVAFAYTEKAG